MSTNNAYEGLVVGYTQALQSNSDDIVLALSELTKKKLSEKDKKALKSITKNLKRIDNNLKKGIK